MSDSTTKRVRLAILDNQIDIRVRELLLVTVPLQVPGGPEILVILLILLIPLAAIGVLVYFLSRWGGRADETGSGGEPLDPKRAK